MALSLNLYFVYFSSLGIHETVEWKEYEICGCQDGKVIQLFSGKTNIYGRHDVVVTCRLSAGKCDTVTVLTSVHISSELIFIMNLIQFMNNH